jgi:hypothetical protein
MKPLSVLVCSLLSLSVAAAEVFRWTDESGQVHFSQRPPPGGAQRMDLPEADAGGVSDESELVERRQRERRLLEAYDYEREQKKARQAREADKQQEVAVQCDRLQQYWRRLSFPGPVYFTREDGEREYLSDERRAAEKARVRQAYVRACGREP